MQTKTENLKRTGLYLALFIIFFVNLFVFEKFKIFGVKPELLLIAVLFFGFNFGIARGIEVGIVSGILIDIFSVGYFGINIVSFTLVGFIAGCLKDKLFKESFIIQFIVSGISVYFISGIYFLYFKDALYLGQSAEFWEICFVKALYTGFIAPILFVILKKLFNLKEI